MSGVVGKALDRILKTDKVFPSEDALGIPTNRKMSHYNLAVIGQCFAEAF